MGVVEEILKTPRGPWERQAGQMSGLSGDKARIAPSLGPCVEPNMMMFDVRKAAHLSVSGLIGRSARAPLPGLAWCDALGA